ncbi:MAG: JAB domain-containing protein [Patescibacteria group bacterium]
MSVKYQLLLEQVAIGKRFLNCKLVCNPILTPRDAYSVFKPIGGLKDEVLEAIYLNAKNCPVHHEVLSVGDRQRALIDIGKVFEHCFAARAVGVILAHNHPSGDVRPSRRDLEQTDNVRKAGKLLERPLVDHLIIGQDRFYSILDSEHYEQKSPLSD